VSALRALLHRDEEEVSSRLCSPYSSMTEEKIHVTRSPIHPYDPYCRNTWLIQDSTQIHSVILKPTTSSQVWVTSTVIKLTLRYRSMTSLRGGSRILQGRVSNPSERGTGGRAPKVEHFPGILYFQNFSPPPQLFWPMLPEPNNFLALEETVGVRRSYDI